MTTPEKLADHAKHITEPSRLRDFLVRLGAAVDALNERCACVNTVPVAKHVNELPEIDETELDLS